MERDSISTIKALNEAIARHNPFNRAGIVRDAEIWVQAFPDVPGLNIHASEAVFQAVDRMRTGIGKVQSIAIVGNPGTGKSHLMRRLRHRLQLEDSALFVYANANLFNDVNLIRYHFQQTLVDSLRRQGSYGVMQCQQLATVMVNGAIKTLTPTAKAFTSIELVRKLAGNTQAKNQAWVNQLTEAFFKTQPDASEPDIVRALVWTLCNAQAAFAIKWLSGKVLAQWKADELGLPNHSREDREAVAWETVLQILHLITDYYPLLICFDDLDSAESNDNNLKRERVVASLVRRLWDNIQLANLRHGVVMLTAMTQATWTDKIKTLPGGISGYISGKGEPIELSDIDDEGIVQLVSLRLQEFYRANHLMSPTLVYPFEADQLRALGRENLTVRQVWEWCGENFRPAEVDPTEKVERAFEGAIASLGGDFCNDSVRVANALAFGFQMLIGNTVEGVTIETVTDEVKPKSANHGKINLKVIVRRNDKIVKIGVAVIQDDVAQTLLAGLKRLTQYKRFDLTCGCLVRSADRIIPRHWQAYGYLNLLKSELGGKWVDLKAEDILPLLAIWSVYQQREEKGLSEGQIFEYVQGRRLCADNSLIREILRGPVEQMADEGIEAIQGAIASETAISSGIATLHAPILEPVEQRNLLPDLM